MSFWELRLMIKNAKNWATSRGLERKNEVHGAQEFRIPTDYEFEYGNTRRREGEGEVTVQVQDPEGTMMDFSDMGEEQTIMQPDFTYDMIYNIVCSYGFLNKKNKPQHLLN